jgi:hypothetical protein
MGSRFLSRQSRPHLRQKLLLELRFIRREDFDLQGREIRDDRVHPLLPVDVVQRERDGFAPQIVVLDRRYFHFQLRDLR